MAATVANVALLAEAMEPFMAAVCCSWTASDPLSRGARGHHALQHVEGRLVCLVGLLGAQSPAPARCCPALRALLPEAAVFTARSLT